MTIPSDPRAKDAAPAHGSAAALGLSSAEARCRLAEYGANATPDASAHPLRLILSKFVAPVPCLLEAAIALQLFLGEHIEAGVIALLLVVNAALGFFHEGRAEATIAALKTRLALSASVRRDGRWIDIPAAELVPGDLVELSLGGVVSADVRLIAGNVLLDQSMITGESLPIEAGPGRETFAGALVRRGEALAEVTATGARTKFGHAAELVRTAHVTSAQQKAIFRVVRNLAAVNGVVVIALLGYAYAISLPIAEFVALTLIAVLATVPVALPATFTLATALGAHRLAKAGVLPTRLSAIDEAASMDVLCSDKTGTLKRNELAVTAMRVLPGFGKTQVLGLAALASSEGGQDPVDRAIRAAAPSDARELPRLIELRPFDPATKMSEAAILDASGARLRVMKGAFATVARLCEAAPEAAEAATAFELEGFRVLGIAVGGPATRLAGIVALSDPPRRTRHVVSPSFAGSASRSRSLPAMRPRRRVSLRVLLAWPAQFIRRARSRRRCGRMISRSSRACFRRTSFAW